MQIFKSPLFISSEIDCFHTLKHATRVWAISANDDASSLSKFSGFFTGLVRNPLPKIKIVCYADWRPRQPGFVAFSEVLHALRLIPVHARRHHKKCLPIQTAITQEQNDPIGHSYKNDEFDWSFLFCDSIMRVMELKPNFVILCKFLNRHYSFLQKLIVFTR